MDDNNQNQNLETENIADKQAVALKYDMQKDKAPRVVAKGKGHTAEHILEAAQKSSVPVYQNKTLVNMLMALDIDREIPPELYKAIAEVMAYVYKMDKAKGRELEERRLRELERERQRRARRGIRR
ncbi:MAG: EscU/YscU/HrcU family type III secretion system export apparatus switch protein [Selenomonadaceae bacterium]|nr:EscU/YscU/HrcU family type III secretion system export apparatus switch protein [Selenomonadaceae bacterium]